MNGAERMVAAMLLIGGFVAVGLMLVGLVALEVHAARTAHPLDVRHVVEHREDGRAVDVFVSVPQIAHTLARWPPPPWRSSPPASSCSWPRRRRGCSRPWPPSPAPATGDT